MKPEALIASCLEEYKLHPIDLHGIGDAVGEYIYLQTHQKSFVRTVSDIQIYVPQGGTILELGSFLGIVSIALSHLGYTMHGTDLPVFVQCPRLKGLYKRNGVSLQALDFSRHEALRVMYGSERFDAVVMCETVEHLNFNPLPLLKKIDSLLAPGGILYIAMPNQASIRNRLKLILGKSIHNPIRDFFAQLDPKSNMVAALHWREYTLQETIEMLKGTGFDTIKAYYFSESSKAWVYSLMLSSFKPSQVVVARKQTDQDMKGRTASNLRNDPQRSGIPGSNAKLLQSFTRNRFRRAH